DIGERSDAVLRTAMPGHDGSASMGGMRRGLDFEKAQAAFKRAAEKAMHGTREERSGRFEPVVQRRSSSHAGTRGGSECVRNTNAGGRDK
ncbi:MAG: hypothetical protein WA893_15320, partial [Xanthobacteraceae bacterium]